MSRFFPLAAYAEDQPLSRTILYTHTIHRGLTAGAFLGIFAGAARTARASFFTSTPISALPRWRSFLSGLEPNVIRSAAVGSVIGAGILVAGTVMRMRGKEEVEWQDRAWRLLHNRVNLEESGWRSWSGKRCWNVMVYGLEAWD
ncbi:hypothetical protein BJ546DRAFT_981249 [Cryomyces antarcticus]